MRDNTIFKNKTIVHLGRAFTIAIGLSGGTMSAAHAEAPKVPANCKLVDQGEVSWYSLPGNTMANRKKYDSKKVFAAHKTLPFGTQVLAVLENGKSMSMPITDRGPFIPGRVLDVSSKAADYLDLKGPGHMDVDVYVCKPA